MGGTYMLSHMGMCHPNGLLFDQKSLDVGSTIVLKILRRGSHLTIIEKKNLVKSVVFDVEKHLEIGADLRKNFEKNSKISHFLRVKNP